MGYSNFMILSDPKLFSYITISGGGQRLDRIFPSAYGDISVDVLTRYIQPALEHHSYS